MFDLKMLKKLARLIGLRRFFVWYRHIGLKESDVFIASYPKSGNTWLRFMLASIITDHECNFDNLADVIPGVERHRNKKYVSPTGRRLIQTHEMWRHTYRKAIYIIRDGRDVAVSYYFYQLRLGLSEGSFSQFLRCFVMAKVDGYGGWQKNVESWLRQHNSDPQSVLLIKYEDMLKGPFDVMRKVVGFLGIEASDKRIRWAIERNSAPHMRNKEQNSIVLSRKTKRANIPFVRRASSGQWKKYFTRDDIELFNEKMGKLNNRLGYCE